MRDLLSTILTRQPLVDKSDGREILTLIRDLVPDLMPERFGNFEPEREQFDPNKLEHALEFWKVPFLWKRRKPSTTGSIIMNPYGDRQHAALRLSTESNKVPSQHLMRFIVETSIQVKADFAFLHLLTNVDVDRGLLSGIISQFNKRHIVVVTGDLEKNIPELYWATIFGSPYVRHFGKDRLLSCPAPIVREIAPDLVLIQLSEDPRDFVSDFEALDQRRQKVKEHLGANSFFNPDLKPDHKYDTPNFDFEEKETGTRTFS